MPLFHSLWESVYTSKKERENPNFYKFRLKSTRCEEDEDYRRMREQIYRDHEAYEWKTNLLNFNVDSTHKMDNLDRGHMVSLQSTVSESKTKLQLIKEGKQEAITLPGP